MERLRVSERDGAVAGSRDVLNAFRGHVASLVEAGRVDEARDAWRDIVTNVAPTFPAEHRAEAARLFAEFERAYPDRTERNHSGAI